MVTVTFLRSPCPQPLIMLAKFCASIELTIAFTVRLALTGKSTTRANGNLEPSLSIGVLERGTEIDAL
jgi:hypothetical protein